MKLRGQPSHPGHQRPHRVCGILVVAALALAGCADEPTGDAAISNVAPAAERATALTGETYSFGVVPQFAPQRIAETWLPILDELERLTGYGFTLDGSSEIPAFEETFHRGGFDFSYMNPYHAIVASSEQGYVPLLRDHGRKLQGVLVVLESSGLQLVEDLEGQIIAFPAPNALGASLMMRALLVDTYGITYDAEYVKTHASVYLQVALGLAAAGGGVRSTLEAQRAEVRDKLRVLAQTAEVAPHPVVYHPRVGGEAAATVQQAFLRLAATPEGAEMLAKIPMQRPGIATSEDYANLVEFDVGRFYVEPTEE